MNTDDLLCINQKSFIFSESYLVDHMWKRTHERNKNLIVGMVGPTGSGKSYASLKFAQVLDPNFTIERVCFNSEQFMKLLNEGIDSGYWKTHPGSVIIYDEAGLGLNSKKWYDAKVQAFAELLQLFRYLRLMVFFTTPDISFITKDARKLFHAVFQTNGIIPEKQLCRIRPQFLQVNPQTGDVYYKFLRVVEDGSTTVIREALLGMPTREIIRAYEFRKEEYGRKIADLTEKRINKIDVKLDRSKLTPHQEQIYELKRSGLRNVDIAQQLAISPSVVTETLFVVKRKGFEVA